MALYIFIQEQEDDADLIPAFLEDLAACDDDDNLLVWGTEAEARRWVEISKANGAIVKLPTRNYGTITP